jgi:tetratricopeptide (TPR) repeat protein
MLTSESPRELRASLTADLSLTLHQAGQHVEAHALASAAHILAEQSGDRRALAQAHNLLGLMANDAGDPQRACDHLGQSLNFASRLGDQTLRMAALNNLALALATKGDLLQAIEHAELALAICDAQGDRHRAAAIHNNIADFLHAAGDDMRAREELTQAVAIFASIGEGTEHLHPTIWKLSSW